MRAPLAVLNRLRLRLWDCRVCVASILIGAATLIVLPPVQDLLLEIKGLPSIAGFAVIVLVFWAIPVHNAAVRSIEKIRRPLPETLPHAAAHFIDHALPPILGIAPILVVVIAARSTAASLDTTNGVAEVDAAVDVLRTMQLCLAGALLLFAHYIVWRRRVLADRRSAFLPSLLRAMPPALGIFTFILLAFAIVDPSGFSQRVGREDLLPVLLGGWVPLFSYLALLSHRTGWPLTLVALLGLGALSHVADRFHDVRTFRSTAWHAAHATPPTSPPRQMSIDTAVDRWMAANGCAMTPVDCPPIVLVAAEGGGSRAAFYTATIIGALLDATRANPDRYRDFARSVFAMSGVSGGALGITLARTALLDAGRSQAPPCRHSDPAWFGYDTEGKDPTSSWRSCLQLLASGDYLSPTIIGATLRDSLAVLFSALTGTNVEDRAALLEQSMEAHYSTVVAGGDAACSGDDDDARGLCRPFGYLPPLKDGVWLPLLFLNATSVDSGRQIIATDLDIGAESGNHERCDDLYPFSYSVFEVLASGGPPAYERPTGCIYPGLDDAPDVRLSTAVVMSARFPLVSPKGNLRNRAGVTIERVIDGAFFDNTGLESLTPLITLLRERRLHPLVIHIANKPWEARRPGAFEIPGRQANRSNPHHVQMNTTSRSSWADSIDMLTSPLLALNNARLGHVERAEAEIMNLLASDSMSAYVSPRLYPVLAKSFTEEADLCDDSADLRFSLHNLSMSWWLSPLVQRIIDNQLCDPRAQLLLTDVLRRLEIDSLVRSGPAPGHSRRSRY